MCWPYIRGGVVVRGGRAPDAHWQGGAVDNARATTGGRYKNG